MPGYLVLRLAPGLYTLSGPLPWYAQGRYFTTAAAALKLVAVLKRIGLKRYAVELIATV